ncbi:hypothetical protein GGX14DRAFT_401234 [Mycena pura]|uniref:Uncharacterized protein n=1 Tax=Mycena pura TaxID=153505 RepID=A0AAD6V1B2_9AGAR|nr:hypothetical protein GGX14DRAFT_401234 [Mycena pura]
MGREFMMGKRMGKPPRLQAAFEAEVMGSPFWENSGSRAHKLYIARNGVALQRCKLNARHLSIPPRSKPGGPCMLFSILIFLRPCLSVPTAASLKARVESRDRAIGDDSEGVSMKTSKVLWTRQEFTDVRECLSRLVTSVNPRIVFVTRLLFFGPAYWEKEREQRACWRSARSSHGAAWHARWAEEHLDFVPMVPHPLPGLETGTGARASLISSGYTYLFSLHAGAGARSPTRLSAAQQTTEPDCAGRMSHRAAAVVFTANARCRRLRLAPFSVARSIEARGVPPLARMRALTAPSVSPLRLRALAVSSVSSAPARTRHNRMLWVCC